MFIIHTEQTALWRLQKTSNTNCKTYPSNISGSSSDLLHLRNLRLPRLFPSACPQKGGGLRSLAQCSGAFVPGTLVQLFNLHTEIHPLNLPPLSFTIPNTVMHHGRTEVCTPDIKRQNILRQHELLRSFNG